MVRPFCTCELDLTAISKHVLQDVVGTALWRFRGFLKLPVLMEMLLRSMRAFLGLSLALALLLGGAGAALAAEVTVFGAASLTNALGAIGKAYEKKSPDHVRFSFASSSVLARQIEAGAPADIYLSANPEWMDYLQKRHLIIDATRTLVVGTHLVLIAPADSAAKPVNLATADLAALLGKDGRLAVGDPAHVPAGIYAKQALVSLHEWDRLSPKLARTDNVRAALALVARGETPYGIVYETDAAISKKVRIVGRFPDSTHEPIRYPMALIAGHDSPAARDFFKYLAGDKAIAIFKSYGFFPAD